MSDLSRTLNGLNPDDEGRYTDAQLDEFAKLVVSGISVGDDVLQQLADRYEKKNASVPSSEVG